MPPFTCAKVLVSPLCRHVIGERAFISTSSVSSAGASSDASSSKTRESGGRRAARDKDGNPIGRDSGPLYRDWLKTTGSQFKQPKLHSTNWLGGKVPFPLNPTFKPPPPLSDALRNTVYNAWLRDPKANSPRRLAAQHSISIKRVEAIIRLKSHQRNLGKGFELQTGFLRAWESATGVFAKVPPEKRDINVKPAKVDRDDAAAADYDADWEQLPSTSISSVYWEPVDDGKTPIVPTTLEELAQTKLSQVASKPRPKSSIKIGSTTFVDVGSKFQHTYSPRNHQKRKEVRAARTLSNDTTAARPHVHTANPTV
ncbi:uncharacterized protein EI90DRAFT_3127975 [Cantharellus anzutake]|uniref:uncharacterized protein n=1 Tax=Cantharellus anzutake TaxID=1750568 RepID=UPI0019061B04|nr:uncharacterized protein EI90DRAFT_3127975 [Cantharellus anzutake]KAF8326374.1 hypothetical protein EI90DRAFT_3127975 [Cantharellus anzutake]